MTDRRSAHFATQRSERKWSVIRVSGPTCRRRPGLAGEAAVRRCPSTAEDCRRRSSRETARRRRFRSTTTPRRSCRRHSASVATSTVVGSTRLSAMWCCRRPTANSLPTGWYSPRPVRRSIRCSAKSPLQAGASLAHYTQCAALNGLV